MAGVQIWQENIKCYKMHYYQRWFGHVGNYLVSYPFLGLAYMYYLYICQVLTCSIRSISYNFVFIVLKNKLNYLSIKK